MKSRITTTLTLAFLVIGLTGYGQNIGSDRLIWNVTSLKDLVTNEEFQYACQFKTNGTDPIQWLQRAGSKTSSLSITSSNGSWPDVTANGSASFQVTLGSNAGSIVFERTGEGITITLDISVTSTDRIYHKYTVSVIDQQ